MEHQEDENLRNLFANAFEKRAKEQLYDIKKDPACFIDLANDPAYAKVKNELRKKLDEELSNQGDPRMNGSEIFDSYPRYSTMRNFEGFHERGKYNPKFKPNK